MFIITDFMLSGILHVDFNHITEYLSRDNLEEFFQEIQSQHPMVLSNEEDKNRFETVIKLTYRTQFLEMIQSLWKIYRQSGVDDLHINPEIENIDRKVWPREIQLLMDELRPLLFGTTKPLRQPTTENIRHSHTYLTFVDSCFHTLQRKHEEYHTMLVTKKYRLPEFNKHLQEQLDIFIKRELLPLQIEIDCQIELICYEYKNEIHRRKLVSHIQNTEQVRER